jgi:Cu-Zn family superoxide dismutase
MLVPATVVLTITLAGCGSGGEDAQGESASTSEGAATEPNVAEVTAELMDADGTVVGNATFTDTDTDTGTQVQVVISGLPPGFHGLHLQEIGLCEPGSADPADPPGPGTSSRQVRISEARTVPTAGTSATCHPCW